MVRIDQVTKKFGQTCYVDHVTTVFEDGKIIGIVGRNGSGKTLLMKMICGLILPTEGVIEVDGKVIGKDVDFPESLGMIIETPGFLPWMNAYESLWDLAAIRKKIGKKEIREVLQLVGLDPDSEKRVGGFSLGMRQRLAIAQAIMESPRLMVLDEPMNGLDESGVVEIRKVLLDRRTPDRTILLTSHNREDIEVLCDEIYYMSQGKMISKNQMEEKV